uniref:Secreted protein n=1 Tax=Heterorhabditis bacteriophora TaxID=37862 RepID=A0A1I7WPB4_HETBA
MNYCAIIFATVCSSYIFANADTHVPVQANCEYLYYIFVKHLKCFYLINSLLIIILHEEGLDAKGFSRDLIVTAIVCVGFG